MSASLWLRLRNHLQNELDPEEFSTWFQPLRLGREEAGRLVLLAPNQRFLHTLEASYRPAVDRAIAGLQDETCEVLF